MYSTNLRNVDVFRNLFRLIINRRENHMKRETIILSTCNQIIRLVCRITRWRLPSRSDVHGFISSPVKRSKFFFFFFNYFTIIAEAEGTLSHRLNIRYKRRNGRISCHSSLSFITWTISLTVTRRVINKSTIPHYHTISDETRANEWGGQPFDVRTPRWSRWIKTIAGIAWTHQI